MAETLNTLKTRRSCRAYKPDHVEQEKLDAMLLFEERRAVLEEALAKAEEKLGNYKKVIFLKVVSYKYYNISGNV